MPSPKITELVKSPGYIYKNPTDLSTPDGYGTCLGYTVGGLYELLNHSFAYLKNEEYGNNIWKKIYLGTYVKVLTLFKNFNPEVLDVSFHNQQASSGYEIMGNLNPGYDLTTRTLKLIFIPDNLNYPCCYMRNASPHIYNGSRITHGHSGYTVFPTLIDVLAKSSNSSNHFQTKKIGDIAL